MRTMTTAGIQNEEVGVHYHKYRHLAIPWQKAGPEPIPRTAFYDEVSNDSK